MKTPIITNYGKLLAEIQFFEAQENDYMVEKLTKRLEAARERDRLEAEKLAKKESE